RHRLGRAHGVVVGLGHQAHSVADANPIGAGGDGPVEDLGVRAVGELGEKVVLDRPHRVPAEAVCGDRLLEGVLIGAPLAALVPGTSDWDLVEKGEPHRPPNRSVPPMDRFEGKTVVVTGAASGIGKATADRLADEGSSVVLVDRAPGGQQVDVTDEEAVAGLFDDVAARHGRIDGVVHAAGVAGGGPVHMLDAAAWRDVLEVNLTGTFFVVKHAVRRMLAQEPVGGERGSIVTLGSIEGLEGTAGGSAYNASKGGVVLLTKNVAIDYGPSGIRANAICPGFIETPITESNFVL